MKTFSKTQFKKKINEKYGSVAKLKKHLKNIAVDEGYGCSIGEVNIDGVRVAYTSNSNHFAEFFVQLRHVGFSSTYALDKKSFTRAGWLRCGQSGASKPLF